MKLLLVLPNSIFNKIQQLIESGKYASSSDFFIAAVENQLLLETTLSKGTDVVLPDTDTISSEKTGEDIVKRFVLKPGKELIKTVAVPLPEQLLYPGSGSENELFLWGQINRIFPMKVGLRILTNLLAEKNEQYIELDEFTEKAVELAKLVRNRLMAETLQITGKKDSLWSGLPSEDSDKSASRYKMQFLAYMRKDGIIEGGLGRLKFVNLKREENRKIYIGITGPGLEFYMLENSILDAGVYNSGSLSEEEKRFYLKHISSEVPGETRAFIDVLSLLKEGRNNQTSLNKELGKIWSKNWSAAVINTQRNGTISRLTELSLMEKIKSGIEVEYRISKTGIEFLTSKTK